MVKVERKIALFCKYRRYLHQTKTIVYTILRPIDPGSFPISSLIIIEVALLAKVFVLELPCMANSAGQLKNIDHK